MSSIKIATWNINSIRIRLELIKRFIEIAAPDIVGFQEIKTQNAYFPAQEFCDMGYTYQFVRGEKSYNGVAFVSKVPFTVEFSLVLCGDSVLRDITDMDHADDCDTAARHVCINVSGTEMHNFYIPAGGDIPDVNLNPKFAYKLAYINAVKKWFHNNRNVDDKIILLGDLNIAPFEHDVWSSKQLKNVVSHTDIERSMMIEMMNDFQWVDTSRKFVPYTEKLYSWWSYRNKDWLKSNRGRRLDHIWVSRSMQNDCLSTSIFTDTRHEDSTSDHVPVILELEI